MPGSSRVLQSSSLSKTACAGPPQFGSKAREPVLCTPARLELAHLGECPREPKLFGELEQSELARTLALPGSEACGSSWQNKGIKRLGGRMLLSPYGQVGPEFDAFSLRF